jgi:hypothetical protein
MQCHPAPHRVNCPLWHCQHEAAIPPCLAQAHLRKVQFIVVHKGVPVLLLMHVMVHLMTRSVVQLAAAAAAAAAAGCLCNMLWQVL